MLLLIILRGAVLSGIQFTDDINPSQLRLLVNLVLYSIDLPGPCAFHGSVKGKTAIIMAPAVSLMIKLVRLDINFVMGNRTFLTPAVSLTTFHYTQH